MSNMRKKQRRTMPCAVDVLGDLPAKGLLAFYESRRRWVFGGPGLSVRGLHAEGVPNDGSNSQHCGSSVFVNTKSAKAQNNKYECLLTIGGVGASILNQTCTTKMGEYRERLLFNRSPVVGYGSNDAAGVSATTAIGTYLCAIAPCFLLRSHAQ
jgi:integrator complex subunit 6